MIGDILLGLGINTALLLALVVLYENLPLEKSPRSRWTEALTGFLTGLIGVMVMLTPWTLVEGVFFDVRSILISVVALFFGALPTLIAALMTAALRIYQGGGGVYMGVAVIFSSAALGLAWRAFLARRKRAPNWFELYLFGLAVHLVMLCWTILLPRPIAFDVLKTIFAPVMLIYPLGVVLLGLTLQKRDQRMKLERELQESRRRFQNLFEYGSIPIWEEDFSQVKTRLDALRRAGVNDFRAYWREHPEELRSLAEAVKIVDVNQAGLEMADAKNREEAQAGFARQFREESWRVFAEELAALAEGALQFKAEIPLWNSRGERRVYYLLLAVQPGCERTLASVLVSFAEATARKQAEEALLESQTKYRAVVEQSKDGVTIADADGRYVMVNPAFCQMTGYTEAELLTMRVADLLPKHVSLKLFPQVARLRQPGQREVTLQRKDGSTFPALIIGSPLDIGGKKYVQGIARDMTEHRQTEENLTRFSRIFEEAANEIYIFDARTLKFLQANRSALQNIGYEMAELEQMTPLDLKPEIPPETFRSWLERLRSGQDRQILFEAVHRRKNGTFYPVEVSLQLSDYEFHPAFFAVILDITERKRAEEQIKRLNENLENLVEERTRELLRAREKLARQERLVALGQMAGGVGHELRNPLGVISNAVFFLRMALPNQEPKIAEYLDLIEKQVAAAEKIVSDLLNFTRAHVAERAPFPLPPLIQQTLERFPPSPHVRLVLDLPADLPRAYADPQHVTQALGNLLLNACQAMPDPAKENQLRISARAEGDMICVSVEDTGVGIAPEALERLFEPLFTTKPKGVGLGLAVSKKLMEANNGRIEVRSELGKGSVFELWLPAFRAGSQGEEGE